MGDPMMANVGRQRASFGVSRARVAHSTALLCLALLLAGSARAQTTRPAQQDTTPTLGLEQGFLEFDIPGFTVKLVKANSTTDELESAPSITLSALSSSDYQMYGGVFRLATTADGASAHWLVLQTASSLDGSNYIVLDRFMLVRGKQPFAFIPNSLAETGASGTEDFDISPNSIGSSPDVGNPAGGVQGGWFDSGSGGGFAVL